jgi:hypothetical protein
MQGSRQGHFLECLQDSQPHPNRPRHLKAGAGSETPVRAEKGLEWDESADGLFPQAVGRVSTRSGFEPAER